MIKKIAILDDNVMDLEHLGDTLRALNLLNFESFTDVDDFLKLDYIDDFDLIIADYFFGNGKTVASLVSSFKISRRTKILVLTNFFEESVFNELNEIRPIFCLKKGCTNLEFQNAINYIGKSNAVEPKHAQIIDGQFFVKIGNNLKSISLNDVLFFNVEKKYINIRMANGANYVIKSSLLDLEKRIPDNFIRLHGAYIVNKNRINSISLSDKMVTIDEHEIPFTRTYKDNLFDNLVIA